MDTIEGQKLQILVLEDRSIRVTWLKVHFNGLAEIKWVTQVNDFIRALEERKPDLIILDHDLGAEGPADEDGEVVNPDPFLSMKDQRGMNGLDAACALALYEDYTDVPVIIWSINYSGRREMAATLSDAGFSGTIIPFTSDNKVWLAGEIARRILK